MFANIRRHSRWLWYFISAAVIISFVWYLNPANDGSGRGGSGLFNTSVGTINGRSISRAEYLDNQREAELKYLFTYGSWYGSDEFSRQNEGFLEREVKQRLFLKEKAKELGIQVAPENIATWIRDAFGREKPFTELEYNNLLTNLAGRGVTEKELNRYVRTEVSTMHLAQVAGTPGRLVTPQEAEAQYRRENQQVSAQGVFFNASNFVSKVNMDAANIGRHFSNQQQNFRLPITVRVSYVEFPATNYFAQADQTLAGITNLNQMVDEMYRQRGTNFYTDPSGLPMAPEAAKAKIKEDERMNLALREARKVANDFAEALLNTTPKHASNLEKLANERKLTVKTTEPFSQYEALQGLDAGDRFNQLAFMLTPEEPFMEEPVVGPEAVYVAALKEKIPSHVPPLAEILDKVTDDYKRIDSQRLAREAGVAFYNKLTADLAAGKAFNASAFEAGLSVSTLPPFSQAARTILGLDPRVDISSVKNTAFALKEGETSRFVDTRDGGFILQVTRFIPVTDADVKTALPAYLANLQRSGQNEAFNEWFMKEMQGTTLSLVTDKQEDEKPGGGAKSTQ